MIARLGIGIFWLCILLAIALGPLVWLVIPNGMGPVSIKDTEIQTGITIGVLIAIGAITRYVLAGR